MIGPVNLQFFFFLECICGSKDENCDSEQPCLQSLPWIKDYKNFWIYSIVSALGLLTIFLIMIKFVFNRVRFTVEETAPLHGKFD